jgi:hypothetical protein
MNGDGKKDIVRVIDGYTEVWIRDEKSGEWLVVQEYNNISVKNISVQLEDMNQDGKKDIFYTDYNKNKIYVRLQLEDGTFGEEWMIEIADMSKAAQAVRVGKEYYFTLMRGKIGRLRLAKLVHKKLEVQENNALLMSGVAEASGKSVLQEIGDFDGDGYDDIVMVDVKASTLWMLRGNARGTFEVAEDYPCLSGIEQMSKAKVGGKVYLLMSSSLEKGLGITNYKNGRFVYPQIIYQGDSVIPAFDVVEAGENASVYWISELKGKYQLGIGQLSQDGVLSGVNFEGIVDPPLKTQGLKVVDLNGDTKLDLIYFSNVAPMLMALDVGQEKRSWKALTGVPDPFLQKVGKDAFRQVDVDGDGKKELLVAKDGMVRVFEVGEGSRVSVKEQISTQGNGGKIAVIGIDPYNRGVWIFDETINEVQHRVRDDKGRYRVNRAFKIKDFKVEQMWFNGSKENQKMILVNGNRIAIMPLDGNIMGLEDYATIECDFEDVNISNVWVAKGLDQNSDVVILADVTNTRVLDFFHWQAQKSSWKSLMHFAVFESDLHFRQENSGEEPRESLFTDINDDGKVDMVLLVHDRLLVYLKK